MKKSLSLLGGVGLALCAALASCSDDVVENVITLPEGTSTEVTLGYNNGIQSIPLHATGDWTAKVEYDGVTDHDLAPEWLGLMSENGTGNATLQFVVDANNTPTYRSARIILQSGDNTLEYKVAQQPYGFGEDNADLDMSMFGSRIPLGYGIRMRPASSSDDNTMNMLLSQVIVLDRFNDSKTSHKELIDALDLSPQNYVRTDTTTNVTMDVVHKEACDSASRLIGADLKVTVAYGLFKLNLNGSFRMFGGSTDSTYCYSAMSTPNKGMFTLNESLLNYDLGNIADYKADTSDDPEAITLKEQAEQAEALILSGAFIKLRDAIEKEVADGKEYNKNSKDVLNRKLKALDNQFGPAYIRSAGIGASAELTYNFTRQENTDTMKIHGDLTFGLNSLLSLDASASADYNNYMKSHMQESAFRYRIKGGDANAAYSMGSDLARLMTANSQITPETVTEKLNAWASTVNSKNATCISYYPTPIWTLFSDEAAYQLMRYFWDAYPNNADGKCPYTFDVQRQIENEGGI